MPSFYLQTRKSSVEKFKIVSKILGSRFFRKQNKRVGIKRLGLKRTEKYSKSSLFYLVNEKIMKSKILRYFFYFSTLDFLVCKKREGGIFQNYFSCATDNILNFLYESIVSHILEVRIEIKIFNFFK